MEGFSNLPKVMGQGAEHGGCSLMSGCGDVPASMASLLRGVFPTPWEGLLLCKHMKSEMTKG